MPTIPNDSPIYRELKDFKLHTKTYAFLKIFKFTQQTKKLTKIITVIFFENRIIIFSDQFPFKFKFISEGNCSLKWFISDLSIDQLAERFLDLDYDPDHARIDLEHYLALWFNESKKWEDGADHAQAQELHEMIKNCGEFMFDSPDILRGHIVDFFSDDEPLTFGWHYNSLELATLTAIQARLKELMR